MTSKPISILVMLLLLGACSGGAPDTSTPASVTSVTSSTTTTTTPATTTSVTATSTTTTTQPAPVESVEVFFSVGDGSDCSMVEGFTVKVPAGEDPIEVSLAALVGGPTDEETEAGASSFFSTDTAEVITSISLEDGLLLVDFVDLRSDLDGASTSCGSEALLSQLNATALQHPNVERVRYSVVGSCSVFFNWLQRQCTEYDRDGGTAVELSVVELALGSGCVPGATELPDGIWFGFLDEVSETTVAFDLACWFSGAPAAEAAAQDGEESPPPNDYYVRNSTELDRTLQVAAGTEVVWLPDLGDPATVARIDYPSWLVERAERESQPGVWVTTTGGAVTLIEEQYVP